jgi:hypothetical protein
MLRGSCASMLNRLAYFVMLQIRIDLSLLMGCRWQQKLSTTACSGAYFAGILTGSGPSTWRSKPAVEIEGKKQFLIPRLLQVLAASVQVLTFLASPAKMKKCDLSRYGDSESLVRAVMPSHCRVIADYGQLYPEYRAFFLAPPSSRPAITAWANPDGLTRAEPFCHGCSGPRADSDRSRCRPAYYHLTYHNE